MSVVFRIPIEYGDFRSKSQYLIYNGIYGQEKMQNLATVYAMKLTLIQPFPNGIFQVLDKSFLSCIHLSSIISEAY